MEELFTQMDLINNNNNSNFKHLKKYYEICKYLYLLIFNGLLLIVTGQVTKSHKNM